MRTWIGCGQGGIGDLRPIGKHSQVIGTGRLHRPLKASSLTRTALLAGVSLISLVAPRAYAAGPTSYQGPDGGAWNNGAYWTNGVPDGGSNTTVNNGRTVVTTGGNDATGTLTVGPVSGSGVTIGNANNLAIGSTVNNAGTITVNSTGSTTELQINHTTVTLSGGGNVTLTNNGNSYIYDNSGYSDGKLVNVDNTIQGTGRIGDGTISLDNQAAGTVNANQSTALVLRTNGAGASNAGKLQATAGGTLSVENTAVTQSAAGTILASGTGSTVLLNNSSVTGGLLTTTGGGTIASVNTPTLSGVTVTNGSTYTVANASNTAFVGTITNNGTIAVASAGSTTEFQVNHTTTTLTGGGSVTLTNNNNSYIYDNSGYSDGKLVNVNNTIQGTGRIGDGTISLDNQAGGTVNANQSAALVLHTNGAGASNAGKLQATAGGTLSVEGTTVTQSGAGAILSSGTGSSVLLNNSTVVGGTLSATSGGTISSVNTATLNGVTVAAGTTYTVANASNTALVGTTVNNGNIAVASAGSTTELQVNHQTSTLSGGGTVTLSNNGNNYIYDNSGYSDGKLVNVNNTIQGAGRIGDGTISLDNQAGGTVNANQSNALILRANGAGVSNAGLLEASSAGTLDIRNTTVTQSGGTILATGAGSTVLLTDSTVVGGTLTTANGGTISSVNTPTLNGVTISAGTTYTVANASNTALVGTTVNNGNIAVASAGSTTELQINHQTSTLSGGGTVTLFNNSNNYILDNSGYSDGVLVNRDNTIQGAGQVGYGSLGISNSGTINANAAGGTMILQGNNFNGNNPTTTAVYNQNLVEASNGGILDLRGTLTQTAAGNLQANTGSTVMIDNATVSGGTLTTVGTGSIQTNGGSNTLSNVTVAPSSTVTIANATNAALVGTITNRGNIAVASGGSTTELQINHQTTTLTGGGTVTLSNNGNNYILDNSGYSDGRLVNADNTIQGGGQLGNGSLSIGNGGTILANTSTALTVNTNGTGLTNTGTLQASNGATMNVTGGPLTNYASGTLTGGTYRADAGSTVNLNTGAITTNAATIVLNGAGSAINTAAGAIDGTLTANAAAGSLSVLGGRSFNTGSNAFNNAGTVTLGGGTFTSAGLSNGGTVTGFGTVASTGGVVGAGTTVANGGTLTLATGISGAGQLQVNAGATASLAGAPASNSVATLAQNGTLATGTSNVTVSSDYTNANFGTGNSFNKRAGVTGTGQILAAGNTAQSISGSGVSNGTSATPTLSLGQYHTADAAHPTGGGSASFTINNTGTSGPALRGAIQTTGVTSASLSGSGVTAGNFGPIAAGGSSGAYTVTSTQAGALSGQTIHIANNFGNVAEQTVTVTGTGYNYAQASAPTTVNLGNFHVGSAPSASVTIGNVAPGGAYTERLDGTVAGTGGGATASGSFTGLAAGGTSNAITVGLSPGSAGAASGTVTLGFTSNAAGVNSLGNSALPSQTVQVTGTGYNLASSSTIGTVNFGVLHTGTGTQSVGIAVTNTAPAGAYSEGLNSALGAYTNNGGLAVTGSGSFSNLAAGSTDSSSLRLSVSTAQAGQISGSVQVLQASNGTNSGLGTTALPTQNPGVTGSVQASGTVFNLASAQINNAQPVQFGNVRIGSTQSQALSITNTAPASPYSEYLAASAGGTSGAATASGSFGPGAGSLAPQATNTGGVTVGLDTSVAGARSGAATINFTSDGSQLANNGTTTALPSQNVSVTGNVYRLANPTVNTPGVSLAARVGGSASAAIGVTNTSPDAYTEGLSASLGTAPAGFSRSGSITNLAAGASNGSSLVVGLNTATSGTFSGTQAINFTSTGAGTDGAADLALAGGSVAVSGKVYQAATASVMPTAVNFGTVHVGDTATVALTVGNTASGALTDVLRGGFGTVSSGFGGSGGLGNGVAAGSSSTALSVSLNTSTAGSYSGSAALALVSHDADLADQAVGTGPISLSGIVNNYAISGLGQSGGSGSFSGGSNAYLLNFGTVTQGSSLTSNLFASNLAIGPADLLSGLFSTLSGSGFDTSGLTSFSNLMAQQQYGLTVSFQATTLGSFLETIDLRGTGSNASGYSGRVADTILTLQGTVVAATPGGGGGTSVPEPGGLAILASAMAGLLAWRRRDV